jgi:hypothetical protein
MTVLNVALNPVEVRVNWQDRAVSSDAEKLRGLVILATNKKYSIAWEKKRWDLEAACSEAAEADWDGYGARRVDYVTYYVAKRFLEALPHTPLDPDIAIDPDGEVSMTWRKAADQLFSVSIGGTGRLSYAGIFGAVNAYGTEYFNEQVPPSIQAGLARLFPTGR